MTEYHYHKHDFGFWNGIGAMALGAGAVLVVMMVLLFVITYPLVIPFLLWGVGGLIVVPVILTDKNGRPS